MKNKPIRRAKKALAQAGVFTKASTLDEITPDAITVISPDGKKPEMEFGPVIVVHQRERDSLVATGVKAHAFGPYPTLADALIDIAVHKKVTDDQCWKVVMPLLQPTLSGLMDDDGADPDPDPKDTDPLAPPDFMGQPGRVH